MTKSIHKDTNVISNLYENRDPKKVIISTSIAQSFMQIFVGATVFLSLVFMKLFIKANFSVSSVSAIFTPLSILSNSIVFLTILGLSTGVAVGLGKKNYERAHAFFNTGGFLGFLFAIAAVAILEGVASPLVHVFSGFNSDVYQHSIVAARILIASLLLLFLSFYYCFSIRTFGSSWIAGLALLSGTLTTCLMQFFILKYGHLSLSMQINMVPISIASGYLVTTIIAITIILTKFKNDVLKIDFAYFRFDKYIFTQVIKYGLASTMLASFSTLLVLALSFCAPSLPTDHVTGAAKNDYWVEVVGKCTPIWILFFTPVNGFHSGAKLYYSYQHGKKDIEKTKIAIKYQIMFTTIYLLVVTIILASAGYYILLEFTKMNSPDSASLIKQKAFDSYLMTLALCGVILSFGPTTAAMSIPQVHKRFIYSIINPVIRSLWVPIVILPIALVLTHHFNNPYIFICSYPTMDVISLIFLFFIIASHWKLLETVHKK